MNIESIQRERVVNSMFGRIGIPELVLILGIALIIFGPRKLPEIGRSLGRGLREFRQATQEVSKSVSFDEQERSDNKNEIKAEVVQEGSSSSENDTE